MTDSLMLNILSGVPAGIAIGAGYFGALWLTVRKLPHLRRPRMAALLSFGVRLGLLGAVLAFLAIMGGPVVLIGTVPGVLASRLAVTWFVTRESEARK